MTPPTSDQVRKLAATIAIGAQAQDLECNRNILQVAHDALREYADLLDRTQWLDIDTFVHSDRVESVLVADATGDVCQAWFDNNKRGWWEINSSSAEYCPRPVYPTHWMPLPAPPASPGTGGA